MPNDSENEQIENVPLNLNMPFYKVLKIVNFIWLCLFRYSAVNWVYTQPRGIISAVVWMSNVNI